MEKYHLITSRQKKLSGDQVIEFIAPANTFYVFYVEGHGYGGTQVRETLSFSDVASHEVIFNHYDSPSSVYGAGHVQVAKVTATKGSKITVTLPGKDGQYNNCCICCAITLSNYKIISNEELTSKDEKVITFDMPSQSGILCYGGDQGHSVETVYQRLSISGASSLRLLAEGNSIPDSVYGATQFSVYEVSATTGKPITVTIPAHGQFYKNAMIADLIFFY